jgi:hypothetical protein
MRYFQLLNENPRRFGYRAGERLLAAGYQQLGKSGSRGTVYHKPGANFVVKVFSNDPAYAAFVDLASRHPNPHFPRFFGRLVHIDDMYAAIRIEVLRELPRDRFDDLDHISTYLWGLGKDIARYPLKQQDYLDAVQWMQARPPLQQACDLIHQHLSKFLLDIKADNLMLRGETIVLSDPVKPS